jgi:hypothetical protein
MWGHTDWTNHWQTDSPWSPLCVGEHIQHGLECGRFDVVVDVNNVGVASEVRL